MLFSPTIECSKCTWLKHHTDFSQAQKLRASNGLYRRCKECINERPRKTQQGHIKYGACSKLRRPIVQRAFVIHSTKYKYKNEEWNIIKKEFIRSLFRLWILTGEFKTFEDIQ